MPPTETAAAFAALVVAVWAIIMARDPRGWLNWWCAQLGISGLETTRQQRRWQEWRLRIVAMAVGVVGLIVALFAVSAVVWSVRQMDFGASKLMPNSVRSIDVNRGANARR